MSIFMLITTMDNMTNAIPMKSNRSKVSSNTNAPITAEETTSNNAIMEITVGGRYFALQASRNIGINDAIMPRPNRYGTTSKSVKALKITS